MKQCTKCLRTLTDDNFHKKLNSLTSHCKDCTATRKRRKRLERQRLIVNAVGNACKDCGITHPNPGFFDWHHIKPNNKSRPISQMLSTASLDKVLVEVSKCVLLCPNCHRLRHISSGHYYNAKEKK